ncbi:MAG: ribosome recycling factor [Candidatus Promineifilaceae bacterium]
MVDEFLDDAHSRMEGAIRSFDEDMAGYRTGRASTRLLDKVIVEMYGVEMSLKQMAVVSVPEPQQLAVRPFDVNSLSAIERAIIKANLGLMPNNDGKLIRLNMPRLTQQRRRDLVRMLRKRSEEAKVAVRNVRRDVRGDLKDMEKEKMITEDELTRAEENLQDTTNAFVKKIDTMSKTKEEEIMEV